jgi:FkbM family methyltransferase
MNRHVGLPFNLRVKQFIKRVLRRIAQLVYRLFLPLLRPIAFRYRAYMSAVIREQLDVIRHDLVREVSQALPVGGVINEQRSLAAGLHQALQATREVIRDDLVDASLRVPENVLRAMAARLDQIEVLAGASARRVAVHSDTNTVLLRSEVGYVLCADTDHAVLAALIDTGDLERGTRLFIQRFIRPGDVFVDVGAHIGLHSLAAARAMKGTGRVFAFEPFPQSRVLLERSFWINGFSPILECYGVAVSDRFGDSRLFLGASSGHHSLYALDGRPEETLDVQLVTLDSALPRNQSVRLLKIDAEGAELEVIRGARNLLANNDDIGIVVECGPYHLKRVGIAIDDWLKEFTDLGYAYRKIDVSSGAILETSLAELSSSESTNLFFARPESATWVYAEVGA